MVQVDGVRSDNGPEKLHKSNETSHAQSPFFQAENMTICYK